MLHKTLCRCDDCCLMGCRIFFYPEDGGNWVLRNVCLPTTRRFVPEQTNFHCHLHESLKSRHLGVSTSTRSGWEQGARPNFKCFNVKCALRTRSLTSESPTVSFTAHSPTKISRSHVSCLHNSQWRNNDTVLPPITYLFKWRSLMFQKLTTVEPTPKDIMYWSVPSSGI
jgi:hypothetical protein